MKIESLRVAIIGLGYVGLPLAVAFGRKFPTVGYDINPNRINRLTQRIDDTRELSPDELSSATQLILTDREQDLASCNFYIVTVPTPVTHSNTPDFTPLVRASSMLGKLIKPGDVIVYESTVYPGATEEICIPVVEKESGLKMNRDFFAGYSPERINPGDKARRITDIVKITSGSTPAAASYIDDIYKSILNVPTHRAPSIRVAEAAKVIENTQRDINISLMNELALICDRLGIDTLDVLEAAGTKWNFLPFRPGLVGGHCISVDPYYLIHKSLEVGHHPDVIIAGRRVNDRVSSHIAEKMIRMLCHSGRGTSNARVLVLGFAFKENCPDARNTRVVDIIRHLEEYCVRVDVYDPMVSRDEALHEYGIELLSEPPPMGFYDGIIVAVGHQQFTEWGSHRIREFGTQGAPLFDVKGLFPREEADARL